MFVEPGVPVYGGMIIGEHTRPQDLDVNPLKNKQLTNVRAAGKDDAVRLSPPRPLPLEIALAYLADDELLEVTPASIRLRKRLLDPHARRRAARENVAAPLSAEPAGRYVRALSRARNIARRLPNIASARRPGLARRVRLKPRRRSLAVSGS
ncbi:50S ribosomal subunit assembly factor BipA [Geodia barretti]|uniref:50S ribosomal subunit assembly factor BipA n=1 Tax=Geodia barretti TaxID=519541 RepID=A0AA35RN77_GEOBA|nr:50S ribosomal subunit assembly factor BipA [Geodia barretti]